ncbi:MAG: ABC transporter ATP-binding protein [Elusimicrobiota bacterium]
MKKNSKNDFSIFMRLTEYVKPYSWKLVQSLFYMAILGGLNALTMWILKEVIDNVLVAKNYRMLVITAIAIPLFFFIKGVFAYIQAYLIFSIAQKATADIRDGLFTHLQRLSLDFYTRKSTGNIIANLTNDVNVIQIAYQRVPGTFVRDGLTVFFLIAFLFYLHWQFALVSMTAFILAGYPMVVFAKKMRSASKEGQSRMAALYTRLQEAMYGIVVTKAFCQEQREIERFKVENIGFYHAIMRLLRMEALSSPVMELIGGLAIAFILWYGGSDVINGVWTTGSFFAFLGAALSAYRPLKNFAELNTYTQQALSAGERIFEVLDSQPSVIEVSAPSKLERLKESIVYKNVSFSYGDDSYVIREVNLTIKKGQVVALVGPSGAGKTTVAYLLPRFYDPQVGSVEIDGKNICMVTLASLRDQIGVVTQDVVLFNETVRNNIAYGCPGSGMDEIIAAAKVANADEFIQKLPQKYDTVVGERGVLVSGGEKQRIAIARAVLKNPAILILDEATSALDAENEKLVQEALERLMIDRTTLVIAHRLATIKRADIIVVVDEGRIADSGKHEELLQRSKLYNKYYNLQVRE